uniref:capsular polysaccharide export protein, LipB/KpsS family n=1 Tax=Marinobacterium profundum TaxID=1714300 RepID=UPI00082FC396|nr:hypothetical protein [Marinobacterium profundum]
MNKKILFTVAAHVTDRPERWKHVAKAYQVLAGSLKKLGHESCFYVHPKSVHGRLKRKDYVLTNELGLPELLIREKPDVCFIWGGRTDADRKTADLIKEYSSNCKVLYSEAGWFPQRDRIYFDNEGTNAEASFSKKLIVGEIITERDRQNFLRMRNRIVRRDLGLHFFSQVSEFKIEPPDTIKKILVPLQDENDSNIRYSSPFKTMRSFVEYLSNSYPQYQFVVRQHPRAPVDNLPVLANVEYQDKSVDLFKQFDEIGLVIGINSTVLLQAAMHNKTVIALGEGIASTGGCVYSMDVNKPLPDFDAPLVDTAEAEKRLAFLLVKRQMNRRKLANKRYVKQSYLYSLINDE